jgi:hypothetical protein
MSSASHQALFMDTIKILLIATGSLLIGALVWNWQGLKNGEKNAPKDELTYLKRQLEEIKREEKNLTIEKKLRDLGTLPLEVKSASSNNAPDSDKVKEMEDKLKEIEAQNKALEEEKNSAQKEVTVSKQEAGIIAQRDLESRDVELRRARQIGDALLMARVKDIVNNPNTGSFVTIEVLMPNNLQSGTTLGIRRKNGIIGIVKVKEIEGNEAIADILPGPGPFTPESGDELIIPPF